MINIIGHRGASGYALENTLESFSIAKKIGIEIVETDVQITKDGKIVVFHDNILDRITDGSGYLSDHTFFELSKLKLKDGSKILLLEELCIFCKSIDLKLVVELKGDSICRKVTKILKTFLDIENFIVASFFHKQIHEIKKEYPLLKTCIIFEGYTTDMPTYLTSRKVDFVSLGFESVNANIVNDLKKNEIKFMFWTLDQKEEIQKAISYSPYAIISNYPDRVRDIMEV